LIYILREVRYVTELQKICEILSRSGVENAELDTAELLSHFCGIDQRAILAGGDQIRSRRFDSAELEAAVSRRAERYPLQYIIGEWEFYRQKYKVNENCLIPRQDTEILVEKLVSLLPKGARFLDLCTGSGCIAVSTLAERTDTSACALDLFDATVALAVENAYLNGVGERFECSEHDVLDSGTPALYADGSFDAVISNPPYIASDVVTNELEKELAFEPRAALDGGDDGLIFYRAIVKNYARLLKKGGFMAFEIGYDQADALGEIAKVAGMSCEVFKDYGGNDRVAILR
jgi:release factor glutamine methyltransferase